MRERATMRKTKSRSMAYGLWCYDVLLLVMHINKETSRTIYMCKFF